MDQFVIDLGPDGGGVAEGDIAALFGTGTDGAPIAREWAEEIGTIDYEIITGVGARALRQYVGREALGAETARDVAAAQR
ncbi:alanine racemase, partial [Mycobacterium tuberculosis]|nr:alanine racemase [Mycobacterium tuberculosis]